ncbi:MAG: FAD/NAD(P)-binding protein [Candidatus Binataceae bacterium]
MNKTIAIVGGGASGALVATRLLQAGAPLRIVLIEPGERLARGVAYGTSCRRHLLNVRAAAMSAYPEAPGHFADWLRDNIDPALTPACFAPRHVYGDYLEAQLRQAQRAAPAGAHFEHEHSRVLQASSGADAAILELHGGKRIVAHRVVLALGNPPPSNPLSNLDCPAPLSPWFFNERYGLGEETPVLLIGVRSDGD